MPLTRRRFATGTAGTLSLAASGLARPAIAQSGPILIGWMGALTGPLAAPSIGFDRGTKWVVEQINSTGGIKGRQIEIVARDTQGDPTKAVNATQELIARQKVHAIWGPPEFRRVTGDHANHGASENAEPASVRGEFAD